MYIPLAGIETKLINNLSSKAIYLPIPQEIEDKLLEHLNGGDYSHLIIRDGKAVEYVKLKNVCGKLVIVRGIDKTKPLGFRCGSSVAYILTKQGVEDMVCQMQECPKEE